MPMAMASFRFGDGAPDRSRLLGELRAQLGPRAERFFDAVELKGESVELTSTDPVALLYGAKVCQALGGVARLPGVDADLHVPLPPWSARPWIEYGVLRRWRIRLGRMAFNPVPSGEPSMPEGHGSDATPEN